MSGFERSNSPERHDASDASERSWPEDFTREDERFASELLDLFPIECEELPPYYIQTLLDNDLQTPLNTGDIRRMVYRVKRAAGVPHQRLFTRQWSPTAWADQVSVAHVTGAVKRASRPVVAIITLLIFCMLGSMYLATPSFAQGLRLLFGNTGAQQVERYPGNVTPEKHVETTSAQTAPMPVFWLGNLTSDYVFQGMRTLPQEQYSRGPIVDIQYALVNRTSQQTGTGIVDIREFQIADSLSAVLQSVQDGSATLTSVNGLPAVYVDGMWVKAPGQRMLWQTGTRSMLIFEREGVIYWVVGDQRDGQGEAQLTQAASQMIPTTISALMQTDMLSVRLIGAELSASLHDPLGYNTELLSVIPRNLSPDTAAGEFITPGQPPQVSQQSLN